MNPWELILGSVIGLLLTEFTDVSPWIARRLARWSAYRWTTDPEIAARYAEEWAAVIDDRPGKLLKLLTALQFTVGAAGRAAPRAGIRVTRATYRALRYKLAPTRRPDEGLHGIRIMLTDEFKIDCAIELKDAQLHNVTWLSAKEHNQFPLTPGRRRLERLLRSHPRPMRRRDVQ